MEQMAGQHNPFFKGYTKTPAIICVVLPIVFHLPYIKW